MRKQWRINSSLPSGFTLCFYCLPSRCPHVNTSARNLLSLKILSTGLTFVTFGLSPCSGGRAELRSPQQLPPWPQFVICALLRRWKSSPADSIHNPRKWCYSLKMINQIFNVMALGNNFAFVPICIIKLNLTRCLYCWNFKSKFW